MWFLKRSLMKKQKKMNQRKTDNYSESTELMTFWGHLDVLRKMLFRIGGVVLALAIFIFIFKEETFRLLLAPKEWDFVTYKVIESFVALFGSDFRFDEFHVNLISTELSSQFMTHISTSIYLALLGSSPYIVYELFRFITPALYENEKRYSIAVVLVVYMLFVLGVLMSYYVLFPISFRFLGTYQVDASITNTITLASYISTFTTLTFVMGLVFQLPVLAFFLAKFGLITSDILMEYRKHAFIVILIIAAAITPPDVFTLILVTIPIYLLYEASILIIKRVEE